MGLVRRRAFSPPPSPRIDSARPCRPHGRAFLSSLYCPPSFSRVRRARRTAISRSCSRYSFGWICTPSVSQRISDHQDGIAEKGDIKVGILHPVKDVLRKEGNQWRNGFTKIFPKGILSLDLHRTAVKFLLLVEISTHICQKLPSSSIVFGTDGLEEFRIEDPVDQIVFVPKMIIKALSAHPAGVADIPHADFGEGLLCHEFLHGLCQRLFCDTGVGHTVTSSANGNA